MTKPENNDLFAVHHAERHLQMHLDYCVAGTDAIARDFVSEYTATFEHRDGLRRVVLAGEWEVDPAAVAARPVEVSA